MHILTHSRSHPKAIDFARMSVNQYLAFRTEPLPDRPYGLDDIKHYIGRPLTMSEAASFLWTLKIPGLIDENTAVPSRCNPYDPHITIPVPPAPVPPPIAPTQAPEQEVGTESVPVTESEPEDITETLSEIRRSNLQHNIISKGADIVSVPEGIQRLREKLSSMPEVQTQDPVAAAAAAEAEQHAADHALGKAARAVLGSLLNTTMGTGTSREQTTVEPGATESVDRSTNGVRLSLFDLHIPSMLLVLVISFIFCCLCTGLVRCFCKNYNHYTRLRRNRAMDETLNNLNNTATENRFAAAMQRHQQVSVPMPMSVSAPAMPISMAPTSATAALLAQAD